jgi:hypothetical protein
LKTCHKIKQVTDTHSGRALPPARVAEAALRGQATGPSGAAKKSHSRRSKRRRVAESGTIRALLYPCRRADSTGSIAADSAAPDSPADHPQRRVPSRLRPHRRAARHLPAHAACRSHLTMRVIGGSSAATSLTSPLAAVIS